MRQLRLMVSQSAPGTKITAKLLRDGKEKTLNASLAAMPEDMFTRGNRPQQRKNEDSSLDALDGVEVVDLDSRARRQFNVPGSMQGALVVNIDPDSNAAEAGLRTGDLILEINRAPVKSAEDAVALSDKAKTERILLRVWRSGGAGARGGTFYLPVDNTKKK